MHTYKSMRSICLAFLGLPFVFSINATAQISGRVTLSPGLESRENTGLSGVIVRAYGIDSDKEKLIAESVTNDQGHYSLVISSNKQVRVIFHAEDKDLVSSVLTPPVRYVQSPRSDLNWVVEERGPAETGISAQAIAPVYIKGKGNDST